MIYLNTDYLEERIAKIRPIHAGLQALLAFPDASPESVYIARSSVSEFVDWCLEVSYKMLRKALREMGFSGGKLQAKIPQDLVREAAQAGLISLDDVEFWLGLIHIRMDNLASFASVFDANTLPLVPRFLDLMESFISTLIDKFGVNSDFATAATVRYEGLSLELQVSPELLDQVKRICKAKIPQLEVWAYGSRVFGNNHIASDLDLVAFNPVDRTIPTELSSVWSAFQFALTPIQIQTFDWAKLPASFKPEIEISHVVIQEASGVQVVA
jgi:predicted nucleotidyltransferase